MPQYVVTPWKYHQELVQARKELYELGGSDQVAQRHGVDLVLAWTLRGKLPHAVESTAILVDAVLHHRAGNNSMFSVRATYSAAFSRFVTGFCDSKQGTQYKRSMFDVAKEIDMPASFVELRHEATHEELPSLVRLHRFARLGLAWLWQYYWVKIGDTVSSATYSMTEISASEKILQSVLADFLKTRISEIRAQATPSGICAVRASKTILVQECRGSVENLRLLVALLAKERIMIPFDRKLGDSMTGAFKIWDELLQALSSHQRAFLRLLIEHLMTLITATTSMNVELDTFREAIYEWLLHFMVAVSWKIALKKDEWAIREMIVKKSLVDSNYWMANLALKVFEDANEDFKRQWDVQMQNLKRLSTIR